MRGRGNRAELESETLGTLGEKVTVVAPRFL